VLYPLSQQFADNGPLALQVVPSFSDLPPRRGSRAEITAGRFAPTIRATTAASMSR